MNPDLSAAFDKPVSVAMATYNGAKYLEEQLDSILSQTHPPKEICVSDDVSSDATISILQKYQSKGLLRFTVNERRLGYVGNFKNAVAMTSPEHYVALSDQDDVWLPEKIEAGIKVLAQIESERPSMVYSDLILVDENKKLINQSFRNELGQDTYIHCLETLLFGGFVNGCTIVMNPVMRSYFNTIPDEECITHDTWLTLIGHTFGNIAQVPESHILYRKHGHNATEVSTLKKRSRFERLKNEIVSAVKGENLFEQELDCVIEFYRVFADQIVDDQKSTIEKFLRLKNKNYLMRKIALHRFFAGKWIR